MEFLNKTNLNYGKRIGLLESKILNSIVVFIVILIAILSWFSAINKNYQKYWGHEAIIGKNQGTIFAVQTVENNIAAAAYPSVIAELLYEGDINSIHPYMSTFYGLGGLAVTICDKGSTKDHCINEKPVSYTRSWWMNNNNVSQLIKNSDFSILTDNHEPGIDWRYKAPKNHQIIDLDFEPEGNIIGRLYYVRNERPTLSRQLTDWFKAGFQTTSTGNKHFTALSIAYFFSLLFSLLCLNYVRLFYINKLKYKKKNTELQIKYDEVNSEVNKKDAEIKEHEGKEKSLQKSLDKKQAENEKIQNDLNDSKDTIKIFEEQVDAENDPIEKEKKQIELKKLNDKIKFLENNLSDVQIDLEVAEDDLTKEKYRFIR